MTAYLGMALIICVPGLLYRKKGNKDLISDVRNISKSKLELFHLFVCFIAMFYLMANRGNISTDFRSYQIIWTDIIRIDNLNELFQYKSVEAGYALFNKCISLFGTDFYILLFVTSLVILLPVFNFAMYSPIAWLSIFIYVTFGSYYSSFNIMRQAMAASIVFAGFKYLYRGDMKRFSLYAIVATFFHGTSLIYFPTYYLIRANTKKIRWWRMFLVYIVLLFSIFALYSGYMVYFKGFNSSDGTGLKGYSFANIATSIVLLAFCVVLHFNEKSAFSPNEKPIRNMTLAGVIFWVVLQMLSLRISYVMRLAGYFVPFIMYAVPLYISKIKNSNNRRIVLIGFVLFGIYNLMNGYGSTMWVGR